MEHKKINFNLALQKGSFGENLIKNYLEERGWIVYCPFTKDKAHYFDQLATKNKEKVIALDVKTKARLNNWNAQGINLKHYEQYLNFVNKVNVPFFIVFIDDKNGDVHTQELIKLIDPIYPNPNIIAWGLNQMIFLFNIGIDNINKLSQMDQRNYVYNPKS